MRRPGRCDWPAIGPGGRCSGTWRRSREANQIGTLQPTTPVAHEADIGPIFDATDPAALDAEGFTSGQLAADDWRRKMLAEGKAPTPKLAEGLKAAGCAGMQLHSFAKGATEQNLNLVLWVWGAELPPRLRLVDDEGRLG